MHSALVLWMVQLLLTSTSSKRGVQPDSGVVEDRKEAKEGSEGGEGGTTREVDEEDLHVSEEENWDLGMGLMAVLAVDLKKEYETLSDSLKRLTTSLTRYVICKKKEKMYVAVDRIRTCAGRP